jgi:THO complex subunit 7
LLRGGKRARQHVVAHVRRSSTRADIERLTTVLEQERTTRRQKEQYAALARRIHAYPSRSDTQSEIERLNSEIGELKHESDAVARALELRSKRFAGFMHALHDMQTLLTSEASEATPMAE